MRQPSQPRARGTDPGRGPAARGRGGPLLRPGHRPRPRSRPPDHGRVPPASVPSRSSRPTSSPDSAPEAKPWPSSTHSTIPRAESDLAAFRQAYGLGPCTSAKGCFKKVNQTGASAPLPAGDYGWAAEISLDLDAVSSACPDCHILLVEANSANTPDLVAAEDAAARLGAVSISNSWGGAEDSTILAADSHFNHPGVAITASSGDSGYGVSWPASSQYVTGVGGTTLATAANARGWTETAWSGAGSGCSAYEPKPAWQHDTGCAKRTVADVSADADPNTGLGVYDTYNSCGSSRLCDLLIGLGLVQGLDGWAQVGGTSLSSPLIASVYALAGNTGSISYGSYPYGQASSLFDVTSGSNGLCAPTYLCTAGPGYDGPTGLGTPNGTSAF